MKTWNNRYLTPLGKITVIKNNLISQCVHLLSTILRSETFLKTLNTIMYKFLWNEKPDKIRRSTISLYYMQGGMKMINIHNFDEALKISWTKKLVTQPNSQWYKLLTAMYENIIKILIFGDQWYSKMSLIIHNQFWHKVLRDWFFIFLFWVLRYFQHCTGHITTGSWKGRGN